MEMQGGSRCLYALLMLNSGSLMLAADGVNVRMRLGLLFVVAVARVLHGFTYGLSLQCIVPTDCEVFACLFLLCHCNHRNLRLCYDLIISFMFGVRLS